jgi:hypothetical protein
MPAHVRDGTGQQLLELLEEVGTKTSIGAGTLRNCILACLPGVRTALLQHFGHVCSHKPILCISRQA